MLQGEDIFEGDDEISSENNAIHYTTWRYVWAPNYAHFEEARYHN